MNEGATEVQNLSVTPVVTTDNSRSLITDICCTIKRMTYIDSAKHIGEMPFAFSPWLLTLF